MSLPNPERNLSLTGLRVVVQQVNRTVAQAVEDQLETGGPTEVFVLGPRRANPEPEAPANGNDGGEEEEEDSGEESEGEEEGENPPPYQE